MMDGYFLLLSVIVLVCGIILYIRLQKLHKILNDIIKKLDKVEETLGKMHNDILQLQKEIKCR